MSTVSYSQKTDYRHQTLKGYGCWRRVTIINATSVDGQSITTRDIIT